MVAGEHPEVVKKSLSGQNLKRLGLLKGVIPPITFITYPQDGGYHSLFFIHGLWDYHRQSSTAWSDPQ